MAEECYCLIECVARLDIREYQQVCIAAYRRGDAFHLGAVSVTGCFDIHGAAYHNRPEIAVSGHLLKFHIINGVRELLVDFFCEVYKGRLLGSVMPNLRHVAKSYLMISTRCCRVG